jgi:hypothetical protein
MRKFAFLFVGGALFSGIVSGQLEQAFPPQSPLRVEDKIAYHIDNAKRDTPESIYHVEQLAHLHALQAVPMLEEKILRTQDPVDKAHIASALMRFGATKEIY